MLHLKVYLVLKCAAGSESFNFDASLEIQPRFRICQSNTTVGPFKEGKMNLRLQNRLSVASKIKCSITQIFRMKK